MSTNRSDRRLPKIRIVVQPSGMVEEIDLAQRFRPGMVCDISAALANCLVAEGWAVFERRDSEQQQLPGVRDRRKRK